RCVYQWTVSIDDGEESGEDFPDPAPANAPLPKKSPEGEEGEEEEEDGEDEEDGPKVEPWSGEDEDLIEGSQEVNEDMTNTASLQQSVTSGLPWISSITDSGTEDTAPCIPDDDLELEWIHGYSAQGSRQNLVYNRNGEIIYPAACVGVVMTKGTKPEPHKQSFNLGHTQAISCLTIHPDKAHVATGQAGGSPTVLVWDSTSPNKTIKARLKLAQEKRAVMLVCFSSDGELLAAACEDEGHTVVVYRWMSGILKGQAKAGVKKVLALCFNLDSQELLAAGHKHFKVWTLSGGGLMRGKGGLFGSGSKVQTLLCAVSISNVEEDGSSFLLGGADGNLLRLEGRKVSTTTEAHEGPVYAIYAYPADDGSGTSLVTGGADGKVKMWDAELGLLNEFDMLDRNYLWGPRPCVRSVCLNSHSDGRKILVGTACSEILEILTSDGMDVNGGTCLMQGHFRDQLWGLAVHHAKPIYSTAGDDGMLKEWNVTTQKLKRQLDLGGWIRAICYSPNGLLIAAGMGGEVEKRSKRHTPREEDGKIKIISGMEENFRVVNELADAAGPISVIRFSPNGNRMAAASLDGNIYLYSVLENFQLQCIAEVGTEAVLRMDMSSDGEWIRAETRSSSASFETHFISAETGEKCTDDKVISNETEFATWSGLCGPQATGVWPSSATGTQDVVSCCRSNSGNLLATANACGGIKLFRYPSVGRSASFKAFYAHSPGAKAVEFLCKPLDGRVISTGSRDRCVMQWRRIIPSPGDPTTLGASCPPTAEEDVWVAAEVSSQANSTKPEVVSDSNPPPLENIEALSGGSIKSEGSKPERVMLKVDFAYGYSCSGSTRGNLDFTSSGKVVLTCASVGVVYDKVN
ncbi:unnamed protein product, partial [Choristocarpus tenellus]